MGIILCPGATSFVLLCILLSVHVPVYGRAPPHPGGWHILSYIGLCPLFFKLDIFDFVGDELPVPSSSHMNGDHVSLYMLRIAIIHPELSRAEFSLVCMHVWFMSTSTVL